ncbi:MAG: hypothetical protein K9N55_15685 [Phycisphaerae bacterium]|nr:hypothetical protein [Phycisphaerae bacterium]
MTRPVFKRPVAWGMILACVSLLTAGCAKPDLNSQPMSVRPVVRFHQGETLHYLFTSHRSIEVQWDAQALAQGDKNAAQTMTETLTLRMAYEPVAVTPEKTVLKATCDSAVVKRSSLTGTRRAARDPVELMTGRSFVLVLDARGRITDANELDALLKELGTHAFRLNGKDRIKDQDMINDVVASQWFLWDAVTSMDPNVERPGDTWTSRLSVPTPMVLRKARDVTYTLADVNDMKATVDMTCVLSPDKAPRSWPIPYAGTFQASGTFGFIRGFKVLSLTGQGAEQFDLALGLSLGYEQTYHMELQGMIPFSMRVMPRILIDQTLSMTLEHTVSQGATDIGTK